MNFHDIHRRTFLARSGLNVGAAALSTLFARDALSSPTALQQQASLGAINPLHHQATGEVSYFPVSGWRPKSSRNV